jgi:large subunit ribosomal protein L9e
MKIFYIYIILFILYISHLHYYFFDFCFCIVRLTVGSRKVRVKGPRGTLTRDFSHQAIDIYVAAGGKQLVAEMWHGDRRSVACIRTIMTHIKNMIVGVTKGYLYKMRMVYNHFPIS